MENIESNPTQAPFPETKSSKDTHFTTSENVTRRPTLREWFKERRDLANYHIDAFISANQQGRAGNNSLSPPDAEKAQGQRSASRDLLEKDITDLSDLLGDLRNLVEKRIIHGYILIMIA